MVRCERLEYALYVAAGLILRLENGRSRTSDAITQFDRVRVRRGRLLPELSSHVQRFGKQPQCIPLPAHAPARRMPLCYEESGVHLRVLALLLLALARRSHSRASLY